MVIQRYFCHGKLMQKYKYHSHGKAIVNYLLLFDLLLHVVVEVDWGGALGPGGGVVGGVGGIGGVWKKS